MFCTSVNVNKISFPPPKKSSLAWIQKAVDCNVTHTCFPFSVVKIVSFFYKNEIPGTQKH